jgi:hypothetical protein
MEVDAGASRESLSTAGELRDYRFPRGAASFSVAAAEGLAVGTTAEGLVLTPGSFATARGGTVELAADGSFTFTPTGAPGTFWGTDLLEIRLPDRALSARLTVYPDLLRLAELATSGGAGFGIGGPRPLDYVGSYPRGLAAAGDVNGDGLEDVVLGLPGPTGTYNGFTYTDGHGAYVLFGTRRTSNIQLEAPPPGTGFGVRGDADPSTRDALGFAVEGVGDVNGDGLDDVLVASHARGLLGPLADPTGTPFGAVYVVFGKTDSDDVDSVTLESNRERGFVIRGTAEYLLVGYDAAGAGDVNGDGLADIVVGVPFYESNARSGIFVIFGKTDGASVLLGDVAQGSGGFSITESSENERWGFSVAGVGDVNGDGLADLAFGTNYRADAESPLAGGVQVVLGQRTPAPSRSIADLEANSTLGFSISGAAAGDNASQVRAAGDVDGDGLDDLLISALAATRNASGAPPPPVAADAGVTDAGMTDVSDVAAPLTPSANGLVYVVRGNSSPANLALSDLERGAGQGFAIVGVTPGTPVGYSFSSGDIDADGHSDLVLAKLPSSTETGAFVVFGSSESDAVRVGTASPEQVLAIECDLQKTFSCPAVSSGFDFNGDGLDDLLIGATLYADAPQLAGGAYLALGYDVRGTLSGRGPALIGDASNDVFELPAQPPLLVRGGHGIDTLHAGRQTPIVDLRARGRWESIEVIDVRGGGPHRVLLDEVALRRIPENQPGFAFSLVRRLTILGDTEDTLELDASGFASRGASGDRIVYGKNAVYYGLEVSQSMTLVPSATPR